MFKKPLNVDLRLNPFGNMEHLFENNDTQENFLKNTISRMCSVQIPGYISLITITLIIVLEFLFY